MKREPKPKTRRPALTSYKAPPIHLTPRAKAVLDTMPVIMFDAEEDEKYRAIARERRASDLEERQANGETLSEDDAGFLAQWRAYHP